jgi:SAM-dependent methyltransferase
MAHDPHISFCLKTLGDLCPKSLLDIGSGFENWRRLIKDRQPGQATDEIRGFVYDRIRPERALDISGQATNSWDLSIIGDLTAQWNKETGDKILNEALRISVYVLINTPIAPEYDRNDDGKNKSWSLSELLALDPIRYTVWNEHNHRKHGSFLLSRTDSACLKNPRPEEAFVRMIQLNAQDGLESVCGHGSSLAQTAEIRQQLPLLFADFDVRSMLDAPCGDFNWMKLVISDVKEYVGADVLPELIAQNRRNLSDPNRKFITLDVQGDELPEVDLIFCRDCLVHFSYQDALRALYNFQKSKSTYLLTTTFTNRKVNDDIITGDWRTLNLQLAPFHFPPPITIINECCPEDGGRYSDKSLGLWRLSDILEPPINKNNILQPS